MRRSPLLVVFTVLAVSPLSAGPDGQKNPPVEAAAVSCRARPLFRLTHSLGPFGPAERARLLQHRLDRLLARGASPDGLRIVTTDGMVLIEHDAGRLLAVPAGEIAGFPRPPGEDPARPGIPAKSAASEASVAKKKEKVAGKNDAGQKEAMLEAQWRLRMLRECLRENRAVSLPVIRDVAETKGLWERIRKTISDAEITVYLLRGALMLVVLLSLLLLLYLIHFVSRRLQNKLDARDSTRLPVFKFRSYIILGAEQIRNIMRALIQSGRFVLYLLLPYFVFFLLPVFFPEIAPWANDPLFRTILYGILLSVAGILLWKGVNISSLSLRHWVNSTGIFLIRPVKFKNVELFSENQMRDLLLMLIRILKLVVLLFLVYAYLTIMIILFPFASAWTNRLLGYILQPLKSVFFGFLDFLPNLFFIVVIVFIARFALRFMRVFFDGIEKERTVVEGFYPDWARPTFRITSFILITFVAVMVFPYLPGSQSDAFKGIGLFLGLLLSLGSSAVVANVVAGVVLTYMRPFHVGDRVRISDTTGDVIEKTLLVTRIRTTKNVDVTVPNGLILGAHIINYSSVAGESGLILHTGVTIGYDVPWKRVHELLVAAALKTSGVKEKPAPFVLQTELQDFYVGYELNAYTDQPGAMARIYSDLHGAIQDEFNLAEVEILSPHYRAQRDGNPSTIPPEESDSEPPRGAERSKRASNE